MPPTYVWLRHYELAVREFDPARLPSLIEAAQAAIDARKSELNSRLGRDDPSGIAAEEQAIADALVGLEILRKKRPVGIR
jgi:hypothetical protein